MDNADNLLVPAEYPIGAVYYENRDEVEVKTHFHNSYEIIYVVEGKIQSRIHNKNYIIGKNSLIFINNMETHYLKVLESPYKRYFFLIKPEYFKSVINEPVLSSIFNNRPDSFSHVIELCPENLEEINRAVIDLNNELNEKKDLWEPAAKSILYRLFIMLYRNYRTYFPLNPTSDAINTIVEIQKYIEEHYLESISLKDVSRLFFMDMYYLSRLFAKVTGFSFKEYLILQRISMAKDLLFHTNENITQICMNSGFNNVNHFIRIFKKFEGITPYQYRKKFSS